MTKKGILSKIGANFVLKDKKLQIDANPPFFVLAERMPAVVRRMEAGGLLKNGIQKANSEDKTSIMKEWSGKRGSLAQFSTKIREDKLLAPNGCHSRGSGNGAPFWRLCGRV